MPLGKRHLGEIASEQIDYSGLGVVRDRGRDQNVTKLNRYLWTGPT
jgi:hypothetical protein